MTDEPDWRGRERREFVRVPHELDVSHRPADSEAEPEESRSADISIGGILLVSSKDVPIGTEIDLLVSSGAHHVREPLHGTVLRSAKSEEDDRYRVGVEFDVPLPAGTDEVSILLPPLIRGLAGKQNRRFVRIGCALPLRFKSGMLGRWHQAETCDLSLGGAMFSTAEKVRKGSLLRLRIPMNVHAELRAKGRAVSVVPNSRGEGSVVSLCFEDLDGPAE